jgi:hypothetical protein
MFITVSVFKKNRGVNPMNLTCLDKEVAVNVDAIASVRFTGNGEGLTANVRFLGFTGAGDALSETISGNAAHKLHEILWGDNGEPMDFASREPSIPPARPEFGRTKAWYYLVDADGRRYFMAYVNAKGSCSMRTFDAETGAFLTKKYRPGNYQTEFVDFTRNAAELTVYSQPNLERDCKERLPDAILAYLKKQVK